MYSYPPMFKRWWKSWTINYGHIWIAIGAFTEVAPLITPTMLPFLPPRWFGWLALVNGLLIYLLRIKTNRGLR